MKFEPMTNHLLLLVEPEPELSSVIHVQRSLEGLARIGRVLAVGPEVRDVRPGMRVFASLTGGIDLPHGTLIQETAVQGVIHV